MLLQSQENICVLQITSGGVLDVYDKRTGKGIERNEY